MAKIIRFPREEFETPLEFLNDTLVVANENEIESVVIAFKMKNGEIMTGYFKADFGTRQELVGHVQCDIIDQMIRANPERYNT